MDRFKNLTHTLLDLPRGNITSEHRQYGVEKAKRKKR